MIRDKDSFDQIASATNGATTIDSAIRQLKSGVGCSRSIVRIAADSLTMGRWATETDLDSRLEK
jgi:hypothetical protein